MPRTTYYTDANGEHWTQRIFAEQCDQTVMFGRKCQGVKGHEGHCWCYDERGWYCYDNNHLELEDDDIASGTTPPDHKEWVHPNDKVKDLYGFHYEESVVTDKELIDRLRRGDIGEGEGIIGPVGWDDDDSEIIGPLGGTNEVDS